MRKILYFLFVSVCMQAQDGSLDIAFNNNVNTGFNNQVFDLEILPNGKILVGGSYVAYNGTDSRGVTRLNSDGTIDLSFNPGQVGANYGNVQDIQVLPDGKILAGGFFSSFNGVAVGNLVRLTTDGAVDTSFNYVNTHAIGPNAIAVQPDNKIIIGGNSSSGRRIARLNPDGTEDPSFDPGTGFYGSPHEVVLQQDGKIIVGGMFTTYNGIPANGLVRINPDGSFDSTFNMGTGLYYQQWNNPFVQKLAVQPDGKILVGGQFVSYNGETANGLLRLNPDGTRDTSFNLGTGFMNGNVSGHGGGFSLQPDGKLLITGYFSSYNGIPHKNIVRLNPDGSIDTTINFGTGLQYGAYDIGYQADGKIVMLTDTFTYNGVPTNGKIIRLQNTFLSTKESDTSGRQAVLFPNPAEDVVQIGMKELPLRFEVYTQTGQLVLKGNFERGSHRFDVQQLQKGGYMVKIFTDTGSVTRKMIKK